MEKPQRILGSSPVTGCGGRDRGVDDHSSRVEMHWSQAIAREIIAHRGEEKHVVATGITPSGDIHIGNLREIIIGDAVRNALCELGVEARLIYVGDTFDPLRRRYPFLPPEYEEHVGKPLSEIPDPEGCHSSYAEHFLSPFIESLDELGIEVEVFRADVMYKSGWYEAEIREALLRRDDLARILHESSGRRLPPHWSPFAPLCSACGRISTTTVTGYKLDGGEGEGKGKGEVYYRCECGNRGTASLSGGGKLAWRVDWAARWKILGVTVEPFGKDHAAPGGSFDSGKRIAEEIYNFRAPYPIPFEHILLRLSEVEGGDTGDEGGKRRRRVTAMSSSRGTNIPVREILEVVPPEILKYLIRRVRPERHIEFDPSMPLLHLIDEYERDTGGIGTGIAARIPFRHFLTLVQVARGDDTRELLAVIRRSGYEVPEDAEEELAAIRRKARYALNWLRRYAPDELKFELLRSLSESELVKELSDAQRRALLMIAHHIRHEHELGGGKRLSATEWHNKIYEVANALDIEPGEVFRAVYIALLGKPSGPRAGWLLASLDTEFLRERFEAAAAGK